MAENKRKTHRVKTKKKKGLRRATASRSAETSSSRKTSGKKVRPSAKNKQASKSQPKEIHSARPSTLGGRVFTRQRASSSPGPGSAGQSGDVQGLSRRTIADSESVEELVQEGQAREAAAISGVENALDPDEAEVHTREILEDDVPEEYRDED
jgi:hypothetical protein